MKSSFRKTKIVKFQRNRMKFEGDLKISRDIKP